MYHSKKAKKTNVCVCFFISAHCTGGCLPSPRKSIIGTTGLNFRVRNENGCISCVEPPEHYADIKISVFGAFLLCHARLLSGSICYTARSQVSLASRTASEYENFAKIPISTGNVLH